MLRIKCRKIYYFFSTNLKKLDNGKTITYKLKFIDSFRFTSRKLSDVVDNLSEIYKKNAKHVRKAKNSNQYAILLSLKIINYVANAKNVKKRWLKQINDELIKKSPNVTNFVMETLLNMFRY